MLCTGKQIYEPRNARVRVFFQGTLGFSDADLRGGGATVSWCHGKGSAQKKRAQLSFRSVKISVRIVAILVLL